MTKSTRGKLSSRAAFTAAIVAAAPILLLAFTVRAAPPDGKGGGSGGGGGGGSGDIPPAYAYVVGDAVITTASETGVVLSKLTSGSKGASVVRSTPSWSPTGARLAYIEHPDWRNQPQIADLYVMAADGSAKTRVHRFDGSPNNGWERHSSIDWLAGNYLAYRSTTGPEAIDLNTGSRRSLGLNNTVGPTLSIGAGLDPSTPGSQGLIAYRAWSDVVTDGIDIHLAMVTVEDDHSLTVDPTTIRKLSLPGNQGFPVISPDELQIAFYDDASADGGRKVATVDLDYSNGVDFDTARTLLVGGLGEFRVRPTWSADSKWIAFTWFDPNQNASEIARIRWDGSGFENVTRSATHEVYPSSYPLIPSTDEP